jgi:hypothetical protein
LDDQPIDELQVIPPSLSDHSLIQFSLPSLYLQPVHTIRQLRGWKSFDSQAFCTALRTTKLFSSDESLDTLSLRALRPLLLNHD